MNKNDVLTDPRKLVQLELKTQDALNLTRVTVSEGIIDPAKVTKSALINAVSISSTLLTTEAAVADIKEEKVAGQEMADMGY